MTNHVSELERKLDQWQMIRANRVRLGTHTKEHRDSILEADRMVRAIEESLKYAKAAQRAEA